MATLETGAGASAIDLRRRVAHHEAITPDAEEERRIRSACAKRPESTTHRLTFPPRHARKTFFLDLSGPSLDLVLVDGAHGFPYPILDWWYLAPGGSRTGGRCSLTTRTFRPSRPSLIMFGRVRRGSFEGAISFRTVCIRKLRDEEPPTDADALAAHGRMSFSYLPRGRRVIVSARMRVFSTRAGLWIVRKLRAPR